jgi:hypothetical protein
VTTGVATPVSSKAADAADAERDVVTQFETSPKGGLQELACNDVHCMQFPTVATVNGACDKT